MIAPNSLLSISLLIYIILIVSFYGSLFTYVMEHIGPFEYITRPCEYVGTYLDVGRCDFQGPPVII